MKIAMGADHAGYELKEKIKARLASQGFSITDEGTNSTDRVDYPEFAQKVAHDVAGHRADFGVVVCGSGIGMAIAANKVAGIRATTATSVIEAQLGREHNDANVLSIGARLLDESRAAEIVDAFLTTPFAHGRHTQRVEKIAEIEKEEARSRR